MSLTMIVWISLSNSSVLRKCGRLQGFFSSPVLFPGVIWLFPVIMKDLCIDKCGGETVVEAVLQVILLIPAGAAAMLAFFGRFCSFPS